MITQSFFIPHSLPGLNEMIAARIKRNGNWNAYADMKRTVGQEVLLIIRMAKLAPMTFCYLTFTWYEPNKKRDPDNIVCARKFILDALVHAGVLGNDGWAEVKGFEDYWTHRKETPGVLVSLRGQVITHTKKG